MTLLFEHPIFLEHRTGQHPESPARLVAVARRLGESGLRDRCVSVEPLPADRELLLRLHPESYLETLELACGRGGGRIESDTVVSPRSFDAARVAVGAACQAVDGVLAGRDTTALCLGRPPGHHALADAPMGFCLLGTVSLAAEHALRHGGLSRVLVVDWDVHHGNGTQDFFYDRDDVWFFSSHRYPFYPGSGAADEMGTGRGLGTTANLPLTFGTARREILTAFRSELADFADRCRPELILISAGFDAHRLDPIGSLGLETEDFGELTSFVRDLARQHCGGRVVSVLEGGYHLDALADSVALHLESLLA